MVCLQVPGGEAGRISAQLLECYDIVSGTTPYRLPNLRLGPSIVTNPAEVDRAIAAITALS